MRSTTTAALALVVVSLVASTPTTAAACRHVSRQGACFANQRSIAGALEMYTLDYCTSPGVLDRETFETLKAKGYLQSIPRDPGLDDDATNTYALVRGTDGSGAVTGPDMVCLRHGFIQPPAGTDEASALEQLRAFGCRDEELLSRASTRPCRENPHFCRRWRKGMEALDVTAVVAALAGLCYLPLGVRALAASFGGGTTATVVLGNALVLTLAWISAAVASALAPLCLGLWGLVMLGQFVALTVHAFTAAADRSAAEPFTYESRELLDAERRFSLKLAKLALAWGGMAALMAILLIPGPGETCTVLGVAAAVGGALGLPTAATRFLGLRQAALRGALNVVNLGDQPFAAIRLLVTAGLCGFLSLCLLRDVGLGRLNFEPDDLVAVALVGGFVAARHLLLAACLGRFLDSLEGLAKPCRAAGAQRRTTGAPRGAPAPTPGACHVKISLRSARCPVCGDGFAADGAVACGACGTPHHHECWDYTGACATFACSCTCAASSRPRADDR